MNNRISESNGPPIVDSRANLFFFLQTLAREAQERAIACKSLLNSSITDEDIAAFKKNNRILV